MGLTSVHLREKSHGICHTDAGLQMMEKILQQELFTLSLFIIKILVEFLFGINNQMLRNLFPVTKDFPQRLHSRSLCLEGVLGG